MRWLLIFLLLASPAFAAVELDSNADGVIDTDLLPAVGSSSVSSGTAAISTGWAYTHENSADPHPSYVTPTSATTAEGGTTALSTGWGYTHENTDSHPNYLTADELVGQSNPPIATKYGYDPAAGAQDSPTATPYGGTARYVATSGTDSGTGTISAPWHTWDYALEHATSGDTIYLRGGTYAEKVDISSTAATAANPIELRSYPGEWAILDSTGIDAPSFWMRSTVSNLRFKNFEVKGSTSTTADNSGVYSTGGSNLQFTNIYSHAHSGSCFKAGYGGDNVIYINCTAEACVDTVAPHAGGDADGFSTGAGGAGTASIGFEYHNNVCKNASDDCYDAWFLSNALYIHNIAYQAGVTTPAGNGNGYKLGGGATSGTNVYYNNIAAECAEDGFIDNSVDSNVNLYNNLAFSSGSQNFNIDQAGVTINATNCVSYNGTSADVMPVVGTVTTSLGGGFGGTVVEADFVSLDIANMNAGTYGVGADATLIDAGTDVGYPYFGAAPDIGVNGYTETPAQYLAASEQGLMVEVVRDTSLSLAQVRGTIITNLGAEGLETYALPELVTGGYSFTFVVGTDYEVRIDPNANNTIFLNEAFATPEDGEYVTNGGGATGDTLYCIAVKTGTDAWDWLCRGLQGTWTEQD